MQRSRSNSFSNKKASRDVFGGQDYVGNSEPVMPVQSTVLMKRLLSAVF